jgi:hypothetical protein
MSGGSLNLECTCSSAIICTRSFNIRGWISESIRSNEPIAVFKFWDACNDNTSIDGIIKFDNGDNGKKFSLQNLSMIWSSSGDQKIFDCCCDDGSNKDIKEIR